MNGLRTAGELITPFINQTLVYLGKREAITKAMQANPIGLASKWIVGLGSACIATKTFSMAWNSKSTTAKVGLYATSFGFAVLTGYEITAALYGRVSFGENHLPYFDEL